jgi:hypothetical protein
MFRWTYWRIVLGRSSDEDFRMAMLFRVHFSVNLNRNTAFSGN